jgi:hypothetical protein
MRFAIESSYPGLSGSDRMKSGKEIMEKPHPHIITILLYVEFSIGSRAMMETK